MMQSNYKILYKSKELQVFILYVVVFGCTYIFLSKITASVEWWLGIFFLMIILIKYLNHYYIIELPDNKVAFYYYNFIFFKKMYLIEEGSCLKINSGRYGTSVTYINNKQETWSVNVNSLTKKERMEIELILKPYNVKFVDNYY